MARRIVFDRFDLPRAGFELGGIGLDGALLFSVRPQSIFLHRAPAGRADLVRARLLERLFSARPGITSSPPAESSLRLKVAALPFQAFEVGETVWLEFDPQQMAPITT